MYHTYKYNGSDKTLVLFHGTGGDENSLLHLANEAAPTMNYLALRGERVDFGQRRFAKIKHENDLLDFEDMLLQATNIRKMLMMLKRRYNIGEMWAMGFSNGASAVTALLLNEEPIFSRAILLRPMDLDIQTKEMPLNHLPVLMHSGKKDHVLDPKLAYQLEERLTRNGAIVEHISYDLDHRMRAFEIEDLRLWFEKTLKGE